MTKQLLFTITTNDLSKFQTAYNNMGCVSRDNYGETRQREYYHAYDGYDERSDWSETRRFWSWDNHGGNQTIHCFITISNESNKAFYCIWTKTLKKKEINAYFVKKGNGKYIPNIFHTKIKSIDEIKAHFPETITKFTPKKSSNLLKTLKKY